eukprot:scaffold425852_cov19-Prasinocladus_malaysianus.AAC.1
MFGQKHKLQSGQSPFEKGKLRSSASKPAKCLPTSTSANEQAWLCLPLTPNETQVFDRTGCL